MRASKTAVALLFRKIAGLKVEEHPVLVKLANALKGLGILDRKYHIPKG